MTNTAMREELIFITNIIKSGSAFGQCQSDGAGVFISPPIFAKYGKGRDVGDCMLARMITNANDVRGELPLLAISRTVPIVVLDDEAESPTPVADTKTYEITEGDVASILHDDEYDDRIFSAEDVLVELAADETKRNIALAKLHLESMCNAGQCTRIEARNGAEIRVWFTAAPFRPE